MTGYWQPTGSSQTHLFRMNQCVGDWDNNGILNATVDFNAFLTTFGGGPGCSQCIDINCDGLFFDIADINAMFDATFGGLGC